MNKKNEPKNRRTICFELNGCAFNGCAPFYAFKSGKSKVKFQSMKLAAKAKLRIKR